MHPLSLVGFVGLGKMGLPMAANAARAGFPVLGLSRTASRTIAPGAATTTEVRDLLSCSCLVVMLPGMDELITVIDKEFLSSWLGAGSDDKHLVVMSSVSPVSMTTYAAEWTGKYSGRLHVIDAPVSGGEIGATQATLAVMVGSTPDEYVTLLPLFQAMGSTVERLGFVGAGSLAKACNQLVVGAGAAALGEAVVIAERSGLDVAALLTVFSRGLAGSRLLDDKAHKILTEDYSPSGAAKYMLKDLQSLQDESARNGAVTPLTDSLRQFFTRLVDSGLGDQDLIATRSAIRNWSAIS